MNKEILATFRELRMGAMGSVVISGTNEAGLETELVLQDAVARALIVPLAAAAAANAGSPRPPTGTPVIGAHLPVTQWHTGYSTTNGETLLALTVQGVGQLVFLFPGKAALECGQALAEQGKRSIPAPGELH